MVAANRLLELGTYKKIGILDLDYHAGNGTFEMSQSSKYNNRIGAYSIHCDLVYEYPSFDGFADYHNRPLKPHCNWETYWDTLFDVCFDMNHLMSEIKFDALIIAFGGDTFKEDPDAIPIGRFDLDLDSYYKMGESIRGHFPNLPIMITQEGGYNMDHIGDIVSSFIKGLSKNYVEYV